MVRFSGRRADGGQACEQERKERSSRPAAGEMEPQAADRTLHAGPELEQAQPHLGQGGRSQLGAVHQRAAKEHRQVVGQGVELETKGIGPVEGRTVKEVILLHKPG